MFALILAYSSLFALALVDNSRGSLLPLIQESLQLNSSKVAFIFAGASMSGAIYNLFLPRLKQKFSIHSLYIFSLFLLPIATLLWKLSTTLPVFFYLGSITFGVGAGGIGTFCNLYVAQLSSDEERQNKLSLLHSMYGVASFLAPLFISYLLSYLDWTWIFIVMSLLSILVGMLFLKNKIAIHAENAKHEGIPWKYIWVSLFCVCAVSSEIFISSRLVDYLYRDEHFTIEKAQFYLSIFFACLLAGRLTFSFVKIPLSKPLLINISFVLTILLTLAGKFIHPIFFATIGLSVSWFFPVTMSWIKESFNAKYFSIVSMVMSFNSFSLLTMHFTVGHFTDSVGIKALMILPIPLSIISLLAFNLGRRSLKLNN